MAKKPKIPRSGQDRRAKHFDPSAMAKKGIAGAGGTMVAALLFKIMLDLGETTAKVDTVEKLAENSQAQTDQRMDSMHLVYNDRMNTFNAQLMALQVNVKDIERGEQDCLRRIGRVEDRTFDTQ